MGTATLPRIEKIGKRAKERKEKYLDEISIVHLESTH